MPTINNTNSVVSTGVALSMPTGDTLTVAANGYLISTGDDAVALTGTSEAYTIQVDGLLASTAVTFAGLSVLGTNNTATINISQSGTIRGADGPGIYVDGQGVTNITNDGTILNASAFGAVERAAGGGAMVLVNNGYIGNPVQWAIAAQGSAAFTLTNTGVIQAGLGGGAITAEGTSVITITNTGTIRGGLSLGGGGDNVDNSLGTITGEIFLGAGGDTFLGSAAGETVNGGDDGDNLFGGSGVDTLRGDAGNDTLGSGDGADILEGGADNDTYFVEQLDTIIEVGGGGTNDIVNASASFALAADDDIETLQTTSPPGTIAINLTGNALGQSITGNAGANILSGLGGIDTLNGAGGNDRLIGGTGKDTQTGGLGSDRFVFKTAADSVVGASRDVITDFTVAGTLERIDLSAFAGTFTFRGTGAFSSAGNEVKFQASGANTLVKIDLDADTAAEMEILLIGTKVLTATDFFL